MTNPSPAHAGIWQSPRAYERVTRGTICARFGLINPNPAHAGIWQSPASLRAYERTRRGTSGTICARFGLTNPNPAHAGIWQSLRAYGLMSGRGGAHRELSALGSD
ncbi:hypothetical protein QUF80_10330 [Desulfococcaceae bacterium HSG8]|nr:hypothetical protein [Desulfococcaceae bacterium HSG8]